jgi:hypothetical protein
MATITYRAFTNADNSVSVTAGTAGSISTASVAVLILSTITKDQLHQAFEALERRLSREELSADLPASYDTTTTTTE